MGIKRTAIGVADEPADGEQDHLLRRRIPFRLIRGESRQDGESNQESKQHTRHAFTLLCAANLPQAVIPAK